MQNGFENRQEAGRFLATKLKHYAYRSDGLVLGLPRGGIPVAFEVAQALDLPLDVFVVRKLGVPQHEELAMGAIAMDGPRVVNREVVQHAGISEKVLDRVTDRERRELERRLATYRDDRPMPAIMGRAVILVDDGLATGATMRAAIQALQRRNPAQTVVAVPVAPADTCAELERQADEVICAQTPTHFGGVGRWYRHFPQTTDDEVRHLLAKAWQQHASR
ncbi:MAG: phosphoribosyltransferase [Chloroflexi bacterium]|nr:phosphoribosyltransferase [Chloroflexota bacterium]